MAEEKVPLTTRRRASRQGLQGRKGRQGVRKWAPPPEKHAGRSVAAPVREGDEGILVVTDDSLRSESSHSSLNLFESLIPRDVPSAQMNTRTENSRAGLRPGSSDRRSNRKAFLQPPGWRHRSDSTCHTRSLSNGRAALWPSTSSQRGGFQDSSAYECPSRSNFWTDPLNVRPSARHPIPKMGHFRPQCSEGKPFSTREHSMERRQQALTVFKCPFAGQFETLRPGKRPKQHC